MDSEYENYNSYIIKDIYRALRDHNDTLNVDIVDFYTAHQKVKKGVTQAVIVVGSAANVNWLVNLWRKSGIITVFWSTEDPYELENNVSYQDLFDLIFTNDLGSLPAYGGQAAHLPLAGSAERFYLEPRPDDELQRDLLFVGTAWPNRVEAINELCANLSNSAKLKIALPANPHIPRPNVKSENLIYDWRCSPRNFSKLANTSRLVLTMGRNFSTRGVSEGSTPPPRLFELALAGTAQISVSNSIEATRYFAPDSEIPVAENLRAATPLIKQIISDKDLRFSLASAAQKRAVSHHTYGARVDVIVSAIQRVQRERRESLAAPASQTRIDTAQPRKILLVAHNRLGKNPGGGVEIYLDTLIRGLRRNFDMYLLVPENLEGRLVFELTLPDRTIIKHETRAPISAEFTTHPEVEEIFFKLIVDHKIDLVHYHHLIGWPFSLPRVSRAAGAMNVFTIHDFYAVCDNFTLISFEKKYCDFPSRSPSFCDLCLGITKNKPIGSQNVRRRAMAASLDAADALVFNTPSSRDLVERVYDLDERKLHIVEMLVPGEWPEPRQIKRSDDPKRPLIVKIAGNFTREKGAYALIEVFRLMQSENIEFHVIGREDSEIAERLNAWNLPNVRRRGGYSQAELPDLLADGDVAIAFSVWPETYLISLSESWLCGLVPIVSDLGAPPERVIDGEDGFVVPAGDYGRVMEILVVLERDRERLGAMRQRVEARQHVRLPQHAQALDKLYNDLLRDRIHRNLDTPRNHCIIYNRRMLGFRYSNNKWTDTSPLWQDDYESKHLHSGLSCNEFPAGILLRMPLKYEHLASLSVDKSAGHIRPAGSGTERSFERGRPLDFIVSPHEGRWLVDVFVSRNLGNAIRSYEIAHVVRREDDGCCVVRWTPHTAGTTDALSFACVYDGRVLYVEERSEPAPVRASLGAPPPDEAVRNSRIVEACGAILDVVSGSAGELSVSGWAFNPVDGTIPRSCWLMVRAEAGPSVLVPAARVRDTTTVGVDPLFAYSGFVATLEREVVRGLLANDSGELTLDVSLAQADQDGAVFTSGVSRTITIRLAGDDSCHVQQLTTRIDAELVERWQNIPFSGTVRLPEDDLRTVAEAFDGRRYFIEIHAEVDRDGRERLIDHYLSRGEQAGLKPRTEFSPAVYREMNPELPSQECLLVHFWRWGRHEGRIATQDQAPVVSAELTLIRSEFDDRFYRAQAFPDGHFSGDAAQHYLSFGERAGFRPNASFDPEYYRAANADLADQKTSLFAHYIAYGRIEGRRPNANSPILSEHADKIKEFGHLFDYPYYTRQMPYIQGSDINPVCHYFAFGYSDGSNPNAEFAEDKAMIAGENDRVRFVQWARNR